MTVPNSDRVLRWSAVIFLLTVAIHGADHVRRGTEVVSTPIRVAGTIQAVLGMVAVILVFVRHRWAPYAAIAVGFASAFLFTAAHVLPSWGVFSDSFLTPAAGARVTWFSWVTALLEIAADLVFGWTGVQALRRWIPVTEPG